MEVKERIAYVRGLIEGAEGFQADATSRAVWDQLLLVCDALAESLSELEEYVESIDADLFQLEEEIYGGELDEEEEDDELLDEDFVRAECPRCGEEVYFEESLLYDDNVEISCPECGEILFRGNNNGRFDPEDEEEPVAPLTDNQELSE
ncbi:MAG TPA: hypothetical protein VK101_08525 [Limnochordia bacterium]|nr:hypothetical protein [Limnochordia bacterium]